EIILKWRAPHHGLLVINDEDFGVELRGLGNPRAVNALRRVMILENPDIVFVSKTRLKQVEWNHIKAKFKLTNVVAVDCRGEGRRRSGGLAILWGSNMEITVRSFSIHHIDVIIEESHQGEWRFTGVYGYPEEGQKWKTGELLRNLKDDDNIPWLCGGDFNLMLSSEEKYGGDDFSTIEADIFRDALRECNLNDLGFIGHEYTWNNNRGGGVNNIQERLDRFVATESWKSIYPCAYVSHLEKRQSDHLPILLNCKGRPDAGNERRHRKLYRFEEMWVRDESCQDVIPEAWRGSNSTISKLKGTASKLTRWNKEKFGSFAKEMRACRTQMKNLMEQDQTKEVIDMMRALDDRMDELEAREELYWKQRSRQSWLQSGDKNSKFFHEKARQRKARNNIERIHDEAGNEYEEEEVISGIFVNYFATFLNLGIMWMDGVWDEQLLRELFDDNIIKAIRRIPLPRFAQEDGCAWFYSKDGDYNVKSGYQVALRQRREGSAPTSRQENEKMWKCLWSANVPPKIKIFGWKALHDGSLLEPSWNTGGLQVGVGGLQTMKEWVSELLNRFKDAEWRAIFWSLLWGIWLMRNVWVFEKRWRNEVDVIHRAMSLMGEYRKSNEQGIGIGAVIRDHTGDVVVAMCKKEEGDYSVEVKEAIALRLGLQITLEAGFTKLVIETDNLKLYHHLHAKKIDTSYFGYIVKDILCLASNNFISFSFVKREGNKVAHYLARLCIHYDDLRVWLEEYLVEVAKYVLEDIEDMPQA
ncbi:hypothetical protein RDABS01_028375, partial [Bienertia sinuspersici]